MFDKTKREENIYMRNIANVHNAAIVIVDTNVMVAELTSQPSC